MSGSMFLYIMFTQFLHKQLLLYTHTHTHTPNIPPNTPLLTPLTPDDSPSEPYEHDRT